MQQFEQDWSSDSFLEVGMKEKLKGCNRACQTVYLMSFQQKAGSRAWEMIGSGCNGQQKQEQLMGQMSGYTVIIRNPLLTGKSQYYSRTSKGCKLQISRVYNTGNRKIAKNLPPPLTPSSCSKWGRRKNLLTWARFRMISFPDFDEQVFISTSYVRTGQAGN